MCWLGCGVEDGCCLLIFQYKLEFEYSFTFFLLLCVLLTCPSRLTAEKTKVVVGTKPNAQIYSTKFDDHKGKYMDFIWDVTPRTVALPDAKDQTTWDVIRELNLVVSWLIDVDGSIE